MIDTDDEDPDGEMKHVDTCQTALFCNRLKQQKRIKWQIKTKLRNKSKPATKTRGFQI